MMSFQTTVRLVLFALFFSILPAHANGVDDELSGARTVFLKGVDGDARAVRQATRRFRSLSARYPENPVFLAYLGASMTLAGRDAQNNLDKQRLTEKGLRVVDEALGMLPDGGGEQPAVYLETLLVAADTYVYIPAFFNRYEAGRKLLQEVLNHRDFNGMAAAYKAAVYFTAALVARGHGDEGEYRRYLTLVVDTDPQGRNGRAAQRLLKE